MARYFLKRIAFAIVTFWAVTLVAFVLFHVIPGGGPPRTEPVFVQYARFAWNLVGHQSLGASTVPPSRSSAANRRRVNELILNAAPITASLVIGGAIVWLLVSIPLGTFSALRPRSLLDRGATVFVLFGMCAHPIWLGLICAYFFSYKLGITPIEGYCEVFYRPAGATCSGVWDWFHHLVLPWFVFACLFMALYTRMLRANVLEALTAEHVRIARAKGAPERTIVVRHVLRNVLLPLVTMLGMDIPVALGGAIYTEVVFSLPGLGLYAWQALQHEDYTLLQGIVIFTSIWVIVANLVVYLLYAFVDPRIRLA